MISRGRQSITDDIAVRRNFSLKVLINAHHWVFQNPRAIHNSVEVVQVFLIPDSILNQPHNPYPISFTRVDVMNRYALFTKSLLADSVAGG